MPFEQQEQPITWTMDRQMCHYSAAQALYPTRSSVLAFPRAWSSSSSVQTNEPLSVHNQMQVRTIQSFLGFQCIKFYQLIVLKLPIQVDSRE